MGSSCCKGQAVSASENDGKRVLLIEILYFHVKIKRSDKFNLLNSPLLLTYNDYDGVNVAFVVPEVFPASHIQLV